VKLQASPPRIDFVAQYAAVAAMTGTMDTVPIMLAEYAKRRKRIVDGLNMIGVKCQQPGGAFMPSDVSHLSGLTQSRRTPRNNCLAAGEAQWRW
jgi:aspartate/methionine/tyrosine aminotransferase